MAALAPHSSHPRRLGAGRVGVWGPDEALVAEEALPRCSWCDECDLAADVLLPRPYPSLSPWCPDADAARLGVINAQLASDWQRFPPEVLLLLLLLLPMAMAPQAAPTGSPCFCFRPRSITSCRVSPSRRVLPEGGDSANIIPPSASSSSPPLPASWLSLSDSEQESSAADVSVSCSPESTCFAR